MDLAWTLFVIYLLFTAWLGWQGHKKTKDFSSFAIGAGDISVFQVGVTLAAATASAATFIINPGFIYVDGLSAFMHLGISVYVGLVFMLFLLSYQFRSQGAEMKALTIPDWIGKRYKSQEFSLYFAFINLLTFAFIVLIVGGISIVMQRLLDVNNITALLITLIFVTSYVIVGGTYAHVFTNMFQGVLMIGVSLLVIWSGIEILSAQDNFWQMLASKDEYLLAWVNPESKFYNDIFSTYVAGFLIGCALVCQPHILTKALYVKTHKEVTQSILVFSGVYLLFTLLLLAGFWAHGVVESNQLIDPSTQEFRQDLVMTEYLENAFPDWLFTIISIILLAAAMSTLDGLLVGLSTITANDLVLNIIKKTKSKDLSHKKKMKIAHTASQVILVIIAILVFFVTINPPKLLGIYGQVGVYGLVIASVPPILNGVLFKNVSLPLVWIASVLSLSIHLLLYAYGGKLFPDSGIAFANPGMTASLSFIVVVIPTLFISWFKKRYNT